MILRLTRPSALRLESLVDRARRAEPTYAEVGATACADLPDGYRHDLYERSLGTGEAAFEHAADALRRWQAHVGAGVEVFPTRAQVVANDSVLLLLKLGCFWAIAPCRVIYAVEDEHRFGFAYGTLPGHPETGEAAFTVLRHEDGDATLQIRSFSRPANSLARIAAPIGRRMQTSVTRRYLDALVSASTSAS